MIDVPNACWYLLDRHVDSAAGDRPAVLGTKGDLTYSGLRARVVRAAGGLKELGLCPEQRLVICMADSPDFVVLFLAALRIGAVPVPVSTMLRPAGLAELLKDSRAVVLAVSADFVPMAEEALRQAPAVRAVVVATARSWRFARIAMATIDAMATTATKIAAIARARVERADRGAFRACARSASTAEPAVPVASLEATSGASSTATPSVADGVSTGSTPDGASRSTAVDAALSSIVSSKTQR